IGKLLQQGYQIAAFDPEATNNVKKRLGDKIVFCSTPYEAVKGRDGLCIFTEWNEFKQIDLKKVKKLMKTPLIFDGRNIYEPNILAGLGFSYFSTGRQPAGKRA
ncbi:UDP-glucose 6-dehydrogenase, partial [Candidatus Roizmanbacteria bacterium]|nr:UDP-glucose 6-dehydrogenase [Candidatus Roizmanbacteria bacterium]